MRIDVLATLALAVIVVGGIFYGKDFAITSIMMSAFYVLALKKYGPALLEKSLKNEEYRKKNGTRFSVFLSLVIVPVLLLCARIMTEHKVPGGNAYVMAFAVAGVLSGAAGMVHLLGNQPAEPID